MYVCYSQTAHTSFKRYGVNAINAKVHASGTIITIIRGTGGTRLFASTLSFLV